MEIKNLYNKLKKPVLYGGLGLATIIGTYSGNEEGLAPFYNKKVGKSNGINVGIYTKFMSGSEFSGINASFGTKNEGTINGLNANVFFSENCGNINGTNITAFVNAGDGGKINGLELSCLNLTDRRYIKEGIPSLINGLQIGILNEAKAGNVAQLGAYNSIEKENGKKKKGLLLNYHFKGKSRK